MLRPKPKDSNTSRSHFLRGLVDCYVTQSRHREAASAAATACQQLGSSARALTLYASVVAKDPYQVCMIPCET